jgi:hypothetical protein
VLRKDLWINQGETWRDTVPVPASNSIGEPLDLAGATVRGQVRTSAASGSAVHTWAVVEDNLELDAATRTVVLHVPANVSTDWTWTAGRWDLEVVDGAGITTRIAGGIALVTPEITR